MPVHELAAEVVRQAYGRHTLAEIKSAVANGASGLLHVDGKVTTRNALDLERTLVATLNASAGKHTELGYLTTETRGRLSREQRDAVNILIESSDRAVVLRGKAGTGKTHTLATAIEGMALVEREVACFAPSTQAVDILRRDGAEQALAGRVAAGAALRGAETVQRFLIDPAMQGSMPTRRS